MKKLTKGLFAVLLVCSLLVTTLAVSGVFASAQAIPENVSATFTGANKEDWVTLSGTKIQDKQLEVMVKNGSSYNIVLDSFTTNATSHVFAMTSGTIIEAGEQNPFAFSGNIASGSVLTVTITYHIEGYPTGTAETCTAYIYASSAEEYTSVSNDAYVHEHWTWAPNSGKNVDADFTLSPISQGTSSVTYADSKSANHAKARVTAAIYVDNSKYATWGDLGLKLTFINNYTGTNYSRYHGFLTYLKLTQSSGSDGSLTFSSQADSVTVDATNRTAESTGSSSDSGTTGFYVLVSGENNTYDIGISGNVPTTATTTYTVNITGHGKTGDGVVSSLLGIDSDEFSPQWTITVYSSNKQALRDRLAELSAMGLNKNSYKSGWDDYVAALKNAYKMLGTNKVTASQVNSALSNLNSKYNALVRYAVVITEHYYYEGTNNENPQPFGTGNSYRKFDMQVENNSSYDVEVKSSDADHPYNRTDVIRTKNIAVTSATNYLETIKQYYWTVDTTALEAAVAEFNATVHEDEDGSPIYTTDSWQNYANEAAESERVIADQTLFQDDINAQLKKLNAAKAALKRLDVDTEWLNELMEWAGNIVNNDYSASDIYKYGWDTDALFASSYAQTRYAELEAAYENAYTLTEGVYTQAQADRACTRLENAIKALRVVDSTTKGLNIVDKVYHADPEQYGYIKTLLNQKIEEDGLLDVYNDIVNNTYNLNEDDFTKDSWYLLQDALYGDFEPGLYGVAATSEPYPIGNDIGEISVPAYSMINNYWYLASQADYNACRDNLKDKLYHLEWIVEYTELQDAYDTGIAIDSNLYIPSTATRLTDDLDYVGAMLDKLAEPQYYGDSEAVTQSKVDMALQELLDAIGGLKKKPVLEVASDKDIVVTGGEDSKVYGETIGKNALEVLADFNVKNEDNVDSYLKIYNLAGRELSENEKVGTGYTIVLLIDDEVNGEEEIIPLETHTFVIAYDVDGDAEVTDADFGYVFDFAFTDSGLEDIYLEAADVNGDGVVDLSDAVMIQEKIYA